MARTLTDNELERLKQTGTIGATSTRERIISVINILAEFTDEAEGMTAKEIARCIGACCGCTPSEKAILDDLHAIEQARPLGLNVTPARKGENVGFRCTGRPLSPHEARIVADLIKTSVFVNPAQREQISQKIQSFASPQEAGNMTEAVYVDSRESWGSADALRAIDVASCAIERHEKVSFRIAAHLMDGSESLSDALEEDPVVIVFSFGRYYLETVGAQDDGAPVMRFHRLDRIRSIIATGKPIEHTEYAKKLRTSVAAETRERIDMLGDADTRLIVLKVAGLYAKYVYDRFGHDTEFFGIDEASATGFVCLRVRTSLTLYRWLIGMCNGIVLAKPDEAVVREVARLPWAAAIEPNHGALRMRLCEDYREVKAGLVQLIEQARGTYE